MVKKQTASQPVPTINTVLPDRVTLAAFLVFILLAGGASVAVRFTYAEMPPFWSGMARFAPAAVFYWAWALIGKIPLPRGKALVGAILYGALGGFSIIFIYWGLVKTPASLYQTIMALSPILTLFFAFF